MDYTIQYLYEGKRPSCAVCDQETRYLALEFKKYCLAHANLAMKEAGRIGGSSKRTWSKGETKETHPSLAMMSEAFSGEGNPFHGKNHDQETQESISEANRLPFSEVVRRVKVSVPGVILLSEADSYLNRQESLLEIRCDTCGNTDNVSLFNIERCWKCRVCHPGGSRKQLDLYHWIKDELGFSDAISSDRNVISPYEVDIWIPSKRVAIEYNGLYWHSGEKEDVFNKTRHREKYDLCKKNDIKLIQFYSDEFDRREQVCRSMIRNALGSLDLKLNARDCQIEELSTKQAQEFLDANHIAGYTRSSYKVGLVHPEYGLVSVATTRTPIQKKWGNVVELARMASKTHLMVRGGASKLLNHLFSKGQEDGFEGLLSYAELRYGEGGVYEHCGLQKVGTTGPNYWYTDGSVRYDRFKFRAQDGLTENEYAQKHGVRSVWGVGNSVYLRRF
jgi:hypothetical protein